MALHGQAGSCRFVPLALLLNLSQISTSVQLTTEDAATRVPTLLGHTAVHVQAQNSISELITTRAQVTDTRDTAAFIKIVHEETGQKRNDVVVVICMHFRHSDKTVSLNVIITRLYPLMVFNPFTPKFEKYILPTFLKRNV